MFSTGSCAPFTLQNPGVRHDFKVLAFDGAEAISCLYAIRVELASERADIDLESLLSQPAFLQFGFDNEGIHGRIEDVRVGESGKRLTHYELTLMPALHYLQFSHDQRVFQNLTVERLYSGQKLLITGHSLGRGNSTDLVRDAAPRPSVLTGYLALHLRRTARQRFDFHQQRPATGPPPHRQPGRPRAELTRRLDELLRQTQADAYRKRSGTNS